MTGDSVCGLRAYTLAPSNALPSRSASLPDYHRPLFLMSGAVLVASPFIFLKQPLAAMAAAVILALLVIAIEAFAKDRNALVRQLQEARLLAETNSDAKLRFLALVSHEMRAPLSDISGVADILSTTNLDSGQNRPMRLMQSSSAALSRIVDDVLLATKGREGRLSLSPAPYDLASTVQQIAEQFARRAQDSGADFAKRPACHAAAEARTGLDTWQVRRTPVLRKLALASVRNKMAPLFRQLPPKLRDLADEFSLMRSRIRLVTQEGDCLYDSEDKLAKQAMTNRADLRETVGLYTRVRQSRADLSDAAMQNLVDKWSKSLIIGASSAQEPACSTQQFSHTLERRPCR